MSAQEFHGARAISDGTTVPCGECFGTGIGFKDGAKMLPFNPKDINSTRAFKEVATNPNTVIHSYGSYGTAPCKHCNGAGRHPK